MVGYWSGTIWVLVWALTDDGINAKDVNDNTTSINAKALAFLLITVQSV